MKTVFGKPAGIVERIASEDGFSLIEVLVALAVFVLVIGSFLSLFTGSYMAIKVSGQRSQALSEIQGEAEPYETAETGKDTFDIVFSGTTITPEGEIITIEKTYGQGRKVSVIYFIPSP